MGLGALAGIVIIKVQYSINGTAHRNRKKIDIQKMNVVMKLRPVSGTDCIATMPTRPAKLNSQLPSTESNGRLDPRLIFFKPRSIIVIL